MSQQSVSDATRRMEKTLGAEFVQRTPSPNTESIGDDVVERAARYIQDWRDGNAGEDDAADTARLVLALTAATPALSDRVRELEDHIAEQITHAETRIADGKELGASVWRIALEDIARENRTLLGKDTRHG